MANLPVPIPRNWTPGETEVASYLNAVRDSLNFFLAPPRVRATQATTATTLATSTWSAIGHDSSSIDTYGMHSNSTNNSRATAIVTGRYRVIGVVAFIANGTGIRIVRLQVNGAPVAGTAVSENATSSLASAPATEATVYLNAGDYVEVAGWQNTGGNLNTAPGTSDFAPSLDVQWIATS